MLVLSLIELQCQVAVFICHGGCRCRTIAQENCVLLVQGQRLDREEQGLEVRRRKMCFVIRNVPIGFSWFFATTDRPVSLETVGFINTNKH